MLTADCKQLIDNDRLRFGLNDLNPDWLLANGFVRTWLWYDWGGSPFHVDVLLTPDGANLSMTNSGKVLENVSREQVVEVLDACRMLNRAFGGSDPTPSSYQKAQGILNAAARP